MSKYQITDEIGEISGFIAARGEENRPYEEACRSLVRYGCEWLDAHPDAMPEFQVFQNISGLILEDNEDAKTMCKHMCDSLIAEHGGDERWGPTGAQMQWAINHALFIKKNGWDKYVEKMKEQKNGKAAGD